MWLKVAVPLICATFCNQLQGRHKVKMVCIDMNSAYRRLVREWFPNARIVADRFHVIRLVNQHFSELCKAIDEKQLAYGRGGMMRLLLTLRDRLTDSQKERLRTYFADRPDIESLYEFLHETADLLRVRAQNIDSCRKYVAELLDKIDQLRKTPFAPLRTLGKTLHNWREEVARMFRFTRNNGITEGVSSKNEVDPAACIWLSVTSKTTACVYAFCAAEMAGELIRNLSGKLPAEGACPRLWCRAK